MVGVETVRLWRTRVGRVTKKMRLRRIFIGGHGKDAPSAHSFWRVTENMRLRRIFIGGHGKDAPSAHSFWRVTENVRLWRMSEMNCRFLEASPRGIVAGVVT